MEINVYSVGSLSYSETITVWVSILNSQCEYYIDVPHWNIIMQAVCNTVLNTLILLRNLVQKLGYLLVVF